MSLNTVTGGLNKGIPTDTVTNATSGSVNQTTKQLNNTTQNVTDSAMPGEFPSDDKKYDQPAPDITFSSLWSSFKTWLFSFFPSLIDRFENWIKGLIAWILPPPRQAKIYEAILNRPIASSFIICQLFCCGVPLLVFLAGVFLFAAVAVLLWAVLSLILAGPILLVASCMGVSLWGWGWVLYGLVRQDQDEPEGGDERDDKGENNEKQGTDGKPRKPKKLEVKKDT
ncbi:hypothetical protein CNMCM5793_008747 [Aspergillus hiratsukae]|uniref:Uncharacterized protein n=1 Tax=Aspergillus hiratsukae TaxID=1194566 RepID=A0A8H6P0B1_9EURO|nr:hypothetical protein CNMCM5793_008747 [Aspergillus hiratsukae]KAF7157987.1 hypothetical protein CNMCM6106_004276 [Aspergillus hiratsukae]